MAHNLQCLNLNSTGYIKIDKFFKIWLSPTELILSRRRFTLITHKTQSVPRSKHTPSRYKTSQLMLYREIIAI